MRQLIDKPSPITGGKLEFCAEPSTVEYRGETIPYKRRFYHCVDSDLEFADDELETANLKEIYDTYRFRHGIPLAIELTHIREGYGIPATAMSIILGLGENQYRLYEDGVVPTPSVGRLLALAFDPQTMMAMLHSARHSFTDKQYRKYYESIVEALPPATYEIEDARAWDYGVFAPFPPSEISISKPAVSSPRKMQYNEYSYARAC